MINASVINNFFNNYDILSNKIKKLQILQLKHFSLTEIASG